MFGEISVQPVPLPVPGSKKSGLQIIHESQQVPGLPHTLLFHDGRQLWGRLLELTSDTIIWERPDFSAPLSIPRADVRRIILASAWESPPSDRQTVTLKLPGGDWLAGDATSTDGRTFEMRLPHGVRWTIPRDQCAWLSLGRGVAPACGLSCSPLEMAGWEFAERGARMDWKDGTLTIRGAEWISWMAVASMCLEVAFEIPAESEPGLRMWFAPFGVGRAAGADALGPGVLRCDFGSENFSWFQGEQKGPRAEVAIPAPEDRAAPVHYRVFLDYHGRRLAVVRNGRKLGHWEWEKADAFIRSSGVVYFDRAPAAVDRALRFRDLRVQPWNQIVQHDGDFAPEDGQPRDAGSAVSGELTALTENDYTFAGATRPRDDGRFIEFSGTPTPLRQADALLDFSNMGHFLVDGLTISGEVAKGRTSFASTFTAAVKDLRAIVLPGNPVASGSEARVIFGNGDELPGSVLSAASGQPLRWQSGTQVLEIAPKMVAGIAFHPPPREFPRDDRAAFVELSNGDRVHAALTDLDADMLRLEHPLLGPVEFARGVVRTLYPRAAFSPLAFASIGAPLGEGADPTPVADADAPIRLPASVTLDERYLVFSRPSIFEDLPSLRRTLPPELTRYELHWTATAILRRAPSFSVGLGSASHAEGLRLNFYYNRLTVYPTLNGQISGKPKMRKTLRPPLGPNPANKLRLLVDVAAGKSMIYLNGELLGTVSDELGKHPPGLGETVEIRLDPFSAQLGSELWIGPWDGERLVAGRDRSPRTLFANDDLIEATPVAWREGNFQIDTENGPLDIDSEKCAHPLWR